MLCKKHGSMARKLSNCMACEIDRLLARIAELEANQLMPGCVNARLKCKYDDGKGIHKNVDGYCKFCGVKFELVEVSK